MNSFIVRFVTGLTRAWVRLYTSGLPPKLREERRSEIDSDLWEQERDACATGRTPQVTASEAFGRWLMGIPADLTWSIDHTLRSRRKEEFVSEPVRQTAYLGVATLMAGLTVITSLAVSLGMFESHVYGHDVARSMWGVVGVSAGAMIVFGLSMGRRLPLVGDLFVTLGAFPLAAILVWTIFLPALWLLLAISLLVRAFRFAST